MARCDYPTLDGLPEPLASEMKNRVGPGRGNIWTMLCWSPDAARTFIDYSESIRHHNDIPPRLRELMILRVGHLCAAPYEMHHHTRIARETGVTEAEFAACVEGPGADGLDDEQRFVLVMVDELVADKTLGAASFARANERFGTRMVADMVLLVGFYTMACMFLNSFAIDIETPPEAG
jgi:4-carboxymuconolactone decarboxylase